MRIALKPCPKLKCDGRPSLCGLGRGHNTFVSCNRCGMHGPRALNEEEAVEHWNELPRFDGTTLTRLTQEAIDRLVK